AEAAHVGTDLGDDAPGGEVADAGDGAQQADRVAERVEVALHFRVDLGQRRRECVILAEVEAEQEARPIRAAPGRARVASALPRGGTGASSRSGSRSPATSASRIARPLRPMTSVSTEPSLRLASSSVFWSRWACVACSRS